jgi:hypothetical protein
MSARSRNPISAGSSDCVASSRPVLLAIAMLSSSSRASAAVSTGRLSLFHDVFGAAHGMGGVHVQDMARHEPVEQHGQRGQVLLHRGRREFALLLDEGSDVDGLHASKLADAAGRAPFRKAGVAFR